MRDVLVCDVGLVSELRPALPAFQKQRAQVFKRRLLAAVVAAKAVCFPLRAESPDLAARLAAHHEKAPVWPLVVVILLLRRLLIRKDARRPSAVRRFLPRRGLLLVPLVQPDGLMRDAVFQVDVPAFGIGPELSRAAQVPHVLPMIRDAIMSAVCV